MMPFILNSAFIKMLGGRREDETNFLPLSEIRMLGTASAAPFPILSKDGPPDRRKKEMHKEGRDKPFIKSLVSLKESRRIF